MPIVFKPDFKKRLAQLPRLADGLIDAKLKRDAVSLVKIFHDGIKNNSLGLQTLSRLTIDSKRRLNLPAPETPLYGKGDKEPDKSYMNMLRIRKVKGGYTVQPSIARHHKSKLRLRDLFEVHEYGAIITVGEGENAKSIRIPPRPAFLKAFTIFGKKKIKEETSKTVKKAIERYIAEGKEASISESKRKMLEGIDNFFSKLKE